MTTLKLIGRLAVLALAAALALNATAAKRDFDGDGKADLVWFSDHPIDTYLAIWLMNGTAPVNGAVLGSTGFFPAIVTGDLNGDGRQDIVVDEWAGPNQGVHIRLMQGTSTIGYTTLPRADQLSLVADFDGDGRADIFWWGSQYEISLMDGIVERQPPVSLAAAYPWFATSAADFNGDGKADLLWRNSSTGESAIWLMDGTKYMSGSIILSDPSWSDALAGDLDGDGKGDLAWRNSVTGETALWLMDGTSMKAGAIVVADGNWTARHFGDFNGDGRSDIIWENGATHATHAWLMNGLTMTVGGSVPLNGASVIVVGDFDGDGRDDLVTADGQPTPAFTTYSLWLMDGLNVKAMSELMYSNYWTVIAP